MILTTVRVADFDQFLQTFSTTGVEKRREHGCKGAWVFRDSADPSRVWTVFDWEIEDYDMFLSDPDAPAIAAELGVQAPVQMAVSVAEYDA